MRSPEVINTHDQRYGRDKTKLTAMVGAALVALTVVLLGVLYSSYSGSESAPTSGDPGRTDNSEGVQPQYPPDVPAIRPAEPAR